MKKLNVLLSICVCFSFIINLGYILYIFLCYRYSKLTDENYKYNKNSSSDYAMSLKLILRLI